MPKQVDTQAKVLEYQAERRAQPSAREPNPGGERRIIEIDKEATLPSGHVMIAKLNHDGPDQTSFRRERVYWLDLCLTPRRPKATARYCDHWSPSRRVEMGALMALPPRKRLELRNQGGRHASLICQLRAEAVDRWLPADFVWTERRLEAVLNISSAPIANLLMRLNHELRSSSVGSAELCEAVLTHLSIELARYLIAASDVDEKGGLASWRQRLIDERVAATGMAFPTVMELADRCKMSARQLSRAFRVSRGCSISDFLEQSRVEAAKRRLCTGDEIAHIAASLGFSSQSSFTAAFRRATGITPGQFRKRISVGRES